MARKWKDLSQIVLPKADMIEHSIVKHKTTIVPYVSNIRQINPAIQSTFFSPEAFAAYILELNNKGYVVGRQVRTKWGADGRIARFMTCPIAGMHFYTTDHPNVMYIVRNENEYTSIAYNEDEVTPI